MRCPVEAPGAVGGPTGDPVLALNCGPGRAGSSAGPSGEGKGRGEKRKNEKKKKKGISRGKMENWRRGTKKREENRKKIGGK